jgi:hypothetical protein
MVYDILINRLSLEKEDGAFVDGHWRSGRICNAILKALRTLLAMEGAFPNVTSMSIDLRPLDNVALINKRILKKMPSAFPRLTRVSFCGNCLDHDTLLEGNFLKFFHALKQPLTFLSLDSIPSLEEIHVATILKCIGSGLTQLEIIGHGGDGQLMPTGGGEENHNMYDALSTNCRQLQKLLLAKLSIRDLTLNLGKVLDLEESLEYLVQRADYSGLQPITDAPTPDCSISSTRNSYPRPPPLALLFFFNEKIKLRGRC